MGLPQRMIALSAAIIVLLVVSQLSTLNSYLDFNTKLELTSDSKIDAQTDQQSVAFCVLAKDEKDLYEWIDYHRQLGVSKFYVMDEYSDPPLKFLISEFIDSGLVEYKRISFFWSNFLHYLGYHSKNHLRSAFDECLHLHGHKHQWLGFLDADEFVILKVCYYIILDHRFSS